MQEAPAMQSYNLGTSIITGPTRELIGQSTIYLCRGTISGNHD